ncbi:MAG: YggS family pyridoxal phosphate-dependent enzyme [Candidatus Omnitrophica bacterium]|nr:YggS family pyridoxal phosphate-dependent enzyme [Candidatus Omnitrophota bacterium]MBU4589420.1 YggS family pyridoxal phosphate-dependent enzyme [Candidatus Omnitrophota bacterium]
MIKENVRGIISELPEGIMLEAACKTRTPEEILEAVDAGVKIIGENYVQEAETAFKIVGSSAKWHFIGHLQKNKVKKAIKIFDVIETVDSFELAQEIDRVSANENKTISVLIEVNSGREKQKFGVFPEDAERLVKKASKLHNIKVMGLMTMGPLSGDPELARPYFVETKKTFERIRSLAMPRVEMRHLSMGMSNSYKVAIEEGANIVRLGTRIFGHRSI